jgi:hypothetical protein
MTKRFLIKSSATMAVNASSKEEALRKAGNIISNTNRFLSPTEVISASLEKAKVTELPF